MKNIIGKAYLALALVAFIFHFVMSDKTPFSGVYIIFIGMPWSFIAGWLLDKLKVTSTLIVYVSFIACVAINYKILAKIVPKHVDK